MGSAPTCLYATPRQRGRVAEPCGVYPDLRGASAIASQESILGRPADIVPTIAVSLCLPFGAIELPIAEKHDHQFLPEVDTLAADDSTLAHGQSCLVYHVSPAARSGKAA